MIHLLAALAAPSTATNGSVPDDATPAAAPTAADDGVTPWQRYVSGKLYTGVFSVHDPAACSASGARKLVGTKLSSPGSKLGPLDHDGLLSNWVGALSLWHGRFVEAGDMVVRARHTCVGIIDSGQANATSYFEGYLVFDPRAMTLVNQAPGVQFHRVDAILAHEYAHQLQYWHGSVFQGERSDRRIELAADCMAAGMLATEGAQTTGAGPVTMYTIEEGVAAAFRAVGDDDTLSNGHHGTPDEREQMARAGVRIALDHYQAGGERWRMHSGDLKTLCEQVVMKRDASSVLRHPSELLEPRSTHPLSR